MKSSRKSLIELSTKIKEIIISGSQEKNQLCLLKIGMLRKSIISSLLNADLEDNKGEDYEFLKYCLEIYWDDPDNFYNKMISYGK